jgi:phosphate transport system substrate-binding protein
MRSLKTPVWLVILAIIMVISLIVTGCTNPGTATVTKGTTVTTTSAADSTTTRISTTASTPTLPPELSGTITESGSTTVQPLAEKLAGAFMTANPKVKITIQGGGTGVGIKSANDGTVDIGAASRELNKDDPALKTFILARDGIAIIVHPSNSVSDLTKDQVRDIFAGKITNWKDAGGKDSTIHVVAREEGSGTRAALQDMVMGKDASGNTVNIVKNAILQSSSGAVLQTVKGDAQAISFDSFGYLNDSIKALSIGGIAATGENARSGKYPIVRPLYFLTKNEPAGLVKAFLDYCQSADAQSIIAKEGYISVK